MTPSPSEFDPTLRALEEELQKLQPCQPSKGFSEGLTSKLFVTDELANRVIESELEAMSPAEPSTALLARLKAALEPEQGPSQTQAPPSKVIPMPHWREFTPIFRVAAVIAVSLGILAMWMTPPPAANTVDSSTPSQSSVAPPLSEGPTLRTLKPVSVDSAILENGGLMIQSNRYRSENMVIEDEVTWERPRPLKTY